MFRINFAILHYTILSVFMVTVPVLLVSPIAQQNPLGNKSLNSVHMPLSICQGREAHGNDWMRSVALNTYK